jgi:hypothetical protein
MGEALLNPLTELLGRMQAGDSGARDALFAAAYAELHRLARAPDQKARPRESIWMSPA